MGKELLGIVANKALFGPGAESLTLQYSIAEVKGKVVEMVVRVRDATGAIVYASQPPIACEAALPLSLAWDGQRNQGAPEKRDRRGRLILQFLTDRHSPYRVEVEADVQPVPDPRPPGISDKLGDADRGVIKCTLFTAGAAAAPAREREVQVQLRTPAVVLAAVTPVFAPSLDDVDIVCKFVNHDLVRAVLIEIADQSGALVDQRVFRRIDGTLPAIPGDNQPVTFLWPRAANGQTPSADFVRLGNAPFTTSIWASASDLEDPADFKTDLGAAAPAATGQRAGKDQTLIRCHSVQLEAMTWAEVYRDTTEQTFRPDAPPMAGAEAEKAAWIQCKLNQIGFFAGPVDGRQDGEDFGKAVRRYRCMRLIPDDRQVAPLGTPAHFPGMNAVNVSQYAGPTAFDALYQWTGDNFVAPPADIAALTIVQGADLNQLCAYLAMERPADTFDAPVNVTNPGASVKLFIRSNRYYMTSAGEWDGGGARWDFTGESNQCFGIASDWLSQPHIPLRAVVKVEDRQGQPVDLFEVVRGVRIAWSWDDEAETLAGLPSYGTGTPSRTKEYLTLAWQDARRGGSALYKNAPHSVGGRIVTEDSTNSLDAFRAYFSSFDDVKPPAGTAPGQALTRVQTWQRGAPTASAKIYLRTSIIGGDCYRVSARLDFSDSGPREAELQRFHTAWTGARAVNNPDIPAGQYRLADERAAPARTAKITVWRRMTVAAMVEWPRRTAANSWNNSEWSEAEWNLMRQEYAWAYLDIPPYAERRAVSIGDAAVFPTMAADYTAAMSAINARNGWEKQGPERELATAELPAVRRELLIHASREEASTKDVVKLLAKARAWKAAPATVDIGTYYESAALAMVNEAGAVLTFRDPLTAAGLAARAAGDFGANGLMYSDFHRARANRLQPMEAPLAAFNDRLRLKFLDAGFLTKLMNETKDRVENEERANLSKDGRTPTAAELLQVTDLRTEMDRVGNVLMTRFAEAATSGMAGWTFKPGITAAALSATPGFGADGTAEKPATPLAAKLAQIFKIVDTFNEKLKEKLGEPAETRAEPVYDLALQWRADAGPEADPIVKATLLEAGNHYKLAIEGVCNVSARPFTFKPNLQKTAVPAAQRVVKPGPTVNCLKTYEPPHVKDLTEIITGVNSQLKLRFQAVDHTVLDQIAVKTASWAARPLAGWQAIDPAWNADWVIEIQKAAVKYNLMLAAIGHQPHAPQWLFKPGLQRDAVNQVVDYQIENRPLLNGVIRFDPTYVFPFQLRNGEYDLATARRMMGEAAAQIGFALSLLLHRGVRQKAGLRVAGSQFERLSDGVILVDNKTHPPMMLAGGRSWTPFGLSMGSALGVFMTSHDTPFRLYGLGAHEWAHELILQHWFNAPGAPKTEHDQSDMNCLMGYPYLVGQRTALPAAGTPAWSDLRRFVYGVVSPAEFSDAELVGPCAKPKSMYVEFLEGVSTGKAAFAVYKERLMPRNHAPHFCGKCNLQLRGWNILAGRDNPVLPRSSAGPDRNRDVFPPSDGYDPLTFDADNL